MANVANGHFDLEMCDDEVLADGPNIYGTLVEGPIREIVEHPGPVLQDLVFALEVRHEFGMRRLEVPNDVVGKCIGV